MSASSPTARAALALVLLSAAACGSSPEQRAAAEQRAQVEDLGKQAARLAAGDSSPAGGARDSVRITSTDGAVVYTLARDTVRMQLADSLVRAVRQKVNASGDSGAGNFAGFIKSTVAGAVGSAMSFVMKTPVRDITSARYDDGELRIESRGGVLHRSTFSMGSHDDKDRTTFAPADARRFIAAVEARQRALGAR